MRFFLTIETDSNAYEKVGVVSNFMDELDEFISERNYGEWVKFINIGFVCIETLPEYEDWYKERKPRYKKSKKVKLDNGSSADITNYFSYDIKFFNDEYGQFKSSGNLQALKIFTRRFQSSLKYLDRFSGDNIDLDVDKLKSDVTTFIAQYTKFRKEIQSLIS